jgi:ribosome-associated translation inhibitor RaiA
MGCILTFIGPDADVEQLLALSPVEPVSVWRRGEPLSSRPGSRVATTSGVTLQISDAEFEELEEQQADAIQFLNDHCQTLQAMRRVEGVESARVDFGIAMRSVIVQSDTFPAELIAAVAKVGCSLDLTQFPTGPKARNLRRYRKAFRASAR